MMGQPAGGGGGFFFDTFTQPAIAYSLRDLSGTDPYVINAERTGDGAQMDFRASEITDGVLGAWGVAGGGTTEVFVETWYNQGTAGDAFAEQTRRNKIAIGGVVRTFNGKPSMLAERGFQLLNFSPTDGDGIVTCCVAQLSNDGSLIDSDASTRISQTIRAVSGAQLESIQFGPTVTTTLTHAASGVSVGDQIVATKYWSATGGFNQLRANGVAAASPAAATTHATGSTTLGIANGKRGVWNAEVQEFLLWNYDYTAQALAIESTVNGYYGVY
jgi:hypothetical protein